MLVDAEEALAVLPLESNWRPGALTAQGAALFLLGENEKADEALASAAVGAARHGSTETQVVALAQRALLAASLGDDKKAEKLAAQANGVVATSGLEGAPARSIEHAASAKVLLHHGRWNEARTSLTAAQDILPHMPVAIPWLAVQTRIELGHGFVTLRDAPAAEVLLGEVDAILACVPGLDSLFDGAEELRREVDAVPALEGNAAGLTPAELRL